MGRHILFAVLSGLLVLGMSTAFAEEPQLSDQEILKAWGQAQTEVQQLSEATTRGTQLLTDEDLDEIGAGFLGGSFEYTKRIVSNNGVLQHTRTRG